MPEIDTTNKCLVSSTGSQIKLLREPGMMSHDDAILLAAWLVAMAYNSTHKFEVVLEAVKNA